MRRSSGVAFKVPCHAPPPLLPGGLGPDHQGSSLPSGQLITVTKGA